MRGTVAKRIRKAAAAKTVGMPAVKYIDTPYSSMVPVFEAGQVIMKAREGFHRVMDRCTRSLYQQMKSAYKAA